MLTKKHVITLNAKTIYHRHATDVKNTMKQSFVHFTIVGIEKKSGTLLNP